MGWAMKEDFDGAELDAYETFLMLASERLKRLQARLDGAYGLTRYSHYHFSQETRTLILSGGLGTQLVAHFQAVGSLSKADGTWLWSWANDTLAPVTKLRMREVRAFGQDRGWRALADPMWKGDEIDGWEMTAAAVEILGAQGGYRTENDFSYLYMMLSDIRLSS
jgi:hypothetical protein